MTPVFARKTALITGGSSGIGLATAQKLAERGANIWLLARQIEALEEAQKSVISRRLNSDQRIEIISANVEKREQIQQAIERIIQADGVPDILINSAGITHPGYLKDLDSEVIQRLIATNYLGTVHTIQSVLPGMVERGSGSIVNIASMAALISLPGYTAYGASKFAVRGFSESLRTEVRRKGIHVAIVYPPDTDTPQLRNELPLRPGEVNILAGLDKVMKPGDVAEYIIKGILKKKFMIIPGVGNQIFFRLHSLAGAWAYPIMDQLVGWALNKANHKSSHQ